MAQFEELLSQIEVDKNELFEKIANLEEENEQHLKEKHSVKVELIQTKTALTESQSQLKKAREHIDMLESLNTYKDEEIKEIGDVSKESQNVKLQYSQSQKTVSQLRKELEEALQVKSLIEKQNIQLAEDLAKERDLSSKIKQENKDLKARYQDNLDQKKKDLELSNIAASKMFNYYKIRETINNRLSNLNMPMSFAGGDPDRKDTNFSLNDLRQTMAGRESTAIGRMSLRTSVFQVRDSHFGQFINALQPEQFSKKKDYLNCHERKNVLADLKANNESKFGGECLSDFIFFYDKKLRKKRMCLLVTYKHVYVYDYRKWKIIFMNELNNLTAMSIATRNCTLVSLHFSSGPDIVIENYRRVEIIVYCAQMMKAAGIELCKLVIRKNFWKSGNSQSSKKGGASKPEDDAPLKDVPMKDLEKAKKHMEVGFLQETIRNSKKTGFMRIYQHGFFSNSFSEYYFILSDLGLVSFKKYGDKHAHKFIPILGGTVKKVPSSVYNKEFVFAVKFADDETVFQAASKVEEEDWIKQISTLQEKCLTSKDTVKEIGKVL